MRRKILVTFACITLLGAGCLSEYSSSNLSYTQTNANTAGIVTPTVDQPQIYQAQQTPTKPIQAPSQTAPNETYTNSYGNKIPSPYAAPSTPTGASAQCRDGTYSFSQHRSGTCSHHGGVAEWLN